MGIWELYRKSTHAFQNMAFGIYALFYFTLPFTFADLSSPTCVRAGGNRILSSFLSYWYGSMTLLLIYSVRNSESINYFPVFRLKNPGKEPSEADSRHWSADCLSLPISKVCLISIPPLSRPLSLYSVVSVIS